MKERALHCITARKPGCISRSGQQRSGQGRRDGVSGTADFRPCPEGQTRCTHQVRPEPETHRSTHARIVADDSPPSSPASFSKGTRRTSTWIVAAHLCWDRPERPEDAALCCHHLRLVFVGAPRRSSSRSNGA